MRPQGEDEDLEPMVLVADDVHARGRRQQRGCLITFGIWLGAVALIFALDRDGETREKWQWLNVAAWLVIIFFAPAVGILQAIDLKNYLDWKRDHSARTAVFRLLIILGAWLSAAVAGGVGLMVVVSAIAGAKSMGVVRASVASLLGLGFLGLALFLVILPFRRAAGETERETRKRREEYEERLANPDFVGIEEMCGWNLPAQYKSLFAENSEWKGRGWMLYPDGIEKDERLYDVLGLVPAHPDAFRPRGGASRHHLAFARGEFCEYWFELGPDDPPVFLQSTEADAPADEQFARIAEQLSEFLGWPKEEI